MDQKDTHGICRLAAWAVAICIGVAPAANLRVAAGETCAVACQPADRPLVPCGPAWDLGLEVRAEYLLWWTDSLDVLPLVTTSPQDTPRDQAGILGLPTTDTLFGGSGLNGDAHSGGRFAVSGWFDSCRSLGFELGYTFLEQDGAAFAQSSTGDPILARPFRNADTGLRDAGLTAYPDIAVGTLSIAAATRFQTAEALLRKTLIEDCEQRFTLLLGYRFAQLEDDLTIADEMTSATDGSSLDLFDRFSTKNTFHGPQIGALAERQSGVWTLQLLTKLALGNTRSQVGIDGWTTATAIDASQATSPGGFFALTNLGRYEQDTFGGLTELGLKLRCDLGCHWRASLGYSFLYWYYLARAGEQVDPTLSVGDLPPGQGHDGLYSSFQFNTTGFWAQGLDFGIEYRF